MSTSDSIAASEPVASVEGVRDPSDAADRKVRYVYLDQNKWIDLARARTGHALGAPFLSAWQAASTAVEQGLTRFPLSAAHYFETQRQGAPDKRARLADTMILLSRLATIAPPHVVVPHEVRTALITVFELNRPLPDPPLVFGTGFNFAFGTDIATYNPPAALNGHVLSSRAQAVMALVGQALTEELFLKGGVGPDRVRAGTALQGRLTGDRFVAGQEFVRDELARIGRHHLNDAMTGTALGDIVQPIIEACSGLDVDPDEVFGSDRATLNALVDSMPSRWVERELRSARQSNPQQPWSPNDLNDITALALAVPYCDVVVTERQWAHVLTSRGIASRYGTRVLRDVRDLDLNHHA